MVVERDAGDCFWVQRGNHINRIVGLTSARREFGNGSADGGKMEKNSPRVPLRTGMEVKLEMEEGVPAARALVGSNVDFEVTRRALPRQLARTRRPVWS